MSQPALADSTAEFMAQMDWLELQASRCRMLWVYVIRRAIHDYVCTRGANAMRRRVLHRQAQDWIFSDNVDYFNSFQSLCVVTDTSPEYWRREAQHQSPSSIRRIELLGRRSSPSGRVH